MSTQTSWQNGSMHGKGMCGGQGFFGNISYWEALNVGISTPGKLVCIDWDQTTGSLPDSMQYSRITAGKPYWTEMENNQLSKDGWWCVDVHLTLCFFLSSGKEEWGSGPQYSRTSEKGRVGPQCSSVSPQHPRSSKRQGRENDYRRTICQRGLC